MLLRRVVKSLCIVYVFYLCSYYLRIATLSPKRKSFATSEIKDGNNNFNKLPCNVKENNALSMSEMENIKNLWFMKGGIRRPISSLSYQSILLWPEDCEGDRITDQLMYVPSKSKLEDSDLNALQTSGRTLKSVLLYFGETHWHIPSGQYVFLKDNCPVSACDVTYKYSSAETVEAIIFKDLFVKPPYKRSPNQVWILYLLESPSHSTIFGVPPNTFNWTATYRHDSDIVAPYEKYVPYGHDSLKPLSDKNYASGKAKKVAWFVSNCYTKNKRWWYAAQLSKFIAVDIYGSCSTLKCSKSSKRCFRMLERNYKFYLAFENSNCRDYITEKFFINGLSHNVIPIVMGAHPDDYARVAPKHSYIHVDDFRSPRELAIYLQTLDSNDTLYNEYFAWKGKGEFINTFFWCRLCAMLHAPRKPKSYDNIQRWWSGKGICIEKGKWP